MKRLWMRVGMTFDVPDETYNRLIEQYGNYLGGIELSEAWVMSNLPYAKIDGETYIPDDDGCWKN